MLLGTEALSSKENVELSLSELVCRNLARIGALTVDQYLSAGSGHLARLPVTSNSTQVQLLNSDQALTNGPFADADTDGLLSSLAQLHQTCQRVFGTTDCLKFEFLEEGSSESKQCILTVTRPDGSCRSYKTQPVFSCRSEAKVNVANVALHLGAVGFIVNGEPEQNLSRADLVLAPLNALVTENSSSTPAIEKEDPLVKQIDDCCRIWRSGYVKPCWFALTDPKAGGKYGCALQIRLSSHCARVYSSDTNFDTDMEAKRTCARIAISLGVIEFIQHGNGQTPFADTTWMRTGHSHLPSAVTLQAFKDSLPQPFPEPLGNRPVTDMNLHGWLNQRLHAARGARLKMNFIWITDGALCLHGCLLRLTGPDKSQSYMVDPQFVKKSDAKNAVCLQAISDGVVDYIRVAGEAVENTITHEMRMWATELVFPTLITECSKIRPGCHPRYEFEKDKDAHGCNLTVALSTTSIPELFRRYSVPIKYRTKADAKVAVACLAVEQGIVEFIRFHGQPPPVGCEPRFSMLDYKQGTLTGTKRKGHGSLRGEPYQKKRKELQGREGSFLSPEDDVVVSDLNGGTFDIYSLPTGPRKNQASGAGTFGSAEVSHGDYTLSQFERKGERASISGSSSRTRHMETSPGGMSNIRGTQVHIGHGGGPHAVNYNDVSSSLAGMPSQANVYAAAHYPSSNPYFATHINGIPTHSYSYEEFPFPHPGSTQSYEPYQGSYFPHPFSRSAPAYNHYYPDACIPYQPTLGLHRPIDHTNVIGPAAPRDSSSVDAVHRAHTKTLTEKGTPKSIPTQQVVCSLKGVEMQAKQVEDAPSYVDNIGGYTATIVQRAQKSRVAGLYDYCTETRVSCPTFHDEKIIDTDGTTRHKVWVILGKERLELPTTFASLEEGRERVAKQVLARLRTKHKVT